MKTCAICGIEKLESCFQKRARAKDGLRPECRDCVKLESADYYRRNVDKIKKRVMNYYFQNRTIVQKKVAAKYRENPAPAKARTRDWKRKNPEAVRSDTRNRRARIRGVSGSHTEAETENLLIEQNYLCANPYCGVDLRLVTPHLDHRIAVANQGSNGIENLQWLCAPCNYRKSTLDPAEWLMLEAIRSTMKRVA